MSNKAGSLCNLGRLKEGVACFDQALRIDPDSATVLYNKGVYLGKIEEALSCYQEALRIVEATDRSGDGEWWEFRLEQAWFNMAAVLEELGEAEAAIECYDQALSLNPRYEKGLIGKGSCLASLGIGDEALRCFDDALEVRSSIEELGRAQVVFDQRVWRGEETLVTAKVRVACLDLKRGKATAIPAELHEQLKRLT